MSSQLISSGQKIQIPCPQPGLFLNEGAKNNIPDSNSLKTSQMISETVSDLKSSDLVIVLVSGGGSALLPAPKPPLTLEEKAKLTAKLSKAGASIQELNSVRIQLSQLKGGKLAVKAQPATGDRFSETFLLLSTYFSEIYYYHLYIVTLILVVSIFMLLSVLCESYYLKIHLILNPKP